MIIEKTIANNTCGNVGTEDFIAEGEIVVTITLSEYRSLIKQSVENKCRKEHESWLEQYNRANEAEKKVKQLEEMNKELQKRLLDQHESGETS